MIAAQAQHQPFPHPGDPLYTAHERTSRYVDTLQNEFLKSIPYEVSAKTMGKQRYLTTGIAVDEYRTAIIILSRYSTVTNRSEPAKYAFRDIIGTASFCNHSPRFEYIHDGEYVTGSTGECLTEEQAVQAAVKCIAQSFHRPIRDIQIAGTIQQ